MTDLPLLHLKPGRERPLLRRHPWIFSGAVKKTTGTPVDGDRIGVVDHREQPLGWGHYFAGSIPVKLVAFGSSQPADEDLQRSLEKAWALRRRLGLGPQHPTTGFRLVHGEGDHLPGLIIDIFGRTAVFQAHSIGMHRERDRIAAFLQQLEGLDLDLIYDRSSRTLPRQYGESIIDGPIRGAATQNTFQENELTFQADWTAGQKTGFFLDQRDNRALIGSLSKGQRVLNAYAYTGGFSIYALAHGATHVTSVDQSAPALDQLDENLAANALSQADHIGVREDVLRFLKENQAPWDMVILDPPAFAKNPHKRHQAVQAYKRLNTLGMQRVLPGGLLCTFSCSQVVDEQLFRDTITAAALDSGRQVKYLRFLSQGPDHPVHPALPDSQYLKGILLEVQ